MEPLNMLAKVKTIVNHHKQLAHVKGELFNIYNILNLKTKEVRTHSAFIAELLNPKGSHLMGSSFLRAFLDLTPEDIGNHLDIDTVNVSIEYFVGVINKEHKTGGRIDILLIDNYGATICIENKIDANDQEEQIERYCNYNVKKNKVVYLSKFGNGPTIFSSGELAENLDFYIIGYQNQIIKWLETCQTIAYDQPILRESIKQYKILIQKITKTLGDAQNIELTTAVAENLEEASLIASKYNQIIIEIKNDFRDKILSLLKLEINGYAITARKDVNIAYASIWFSNAQVNEKERWFGVESFSGLGHNGGLLFVGIFDSKGVGLGKDYNLLKKNWVHHEILRYDNKEVNLSDSVFLQKIYNNDQLEIVARNIASQIVDFVNENSHLLSN